MRRRHRPSLVIVAVLVVAAAACGGDDTSSSTPTSSTLPDQTVPDQTVPDVTIPDDTVPADTVPEPSGPTIEGWPVDASLVEAAVADLTASLDVAMAAVVVERAEPVTWRDGSLGCSQPDLAYTQALVDGYRVELSADGSTYWYHGASDADPFRCDDPQDPAPGGSGDR